MRGGVEGQGGAAHRGPPAPHAGHPRPRRQPAATGELSRARAARGRGAGPPPARARAVPAGRARRRGEHERGQDVRPAGVGAGRPGGHRRGPVRQVPRRRVRRPAGRAAAPDHPPVPGRLAALARHRRRPPRPSPGEGPLELRVHLDAVGGPGFDLTEAGTQKRLSVYLVSDPQQVPGIARLGPDALALVARRVRASCSPGAPSGSRRCSSTSSAIAGVGNAYSDEILHTAKLSPYAVSGRLTAGAGRRAVRGDAHRAHRRRRAVRSARARRSSRARSAPACGCTRAPGCRARSAVTPCGRCRSRTGRSSTVPAARPVASRSPTGGCRGW